MSTLPPPTPEDAYARKSAPCVILRTTEETGDANGLMAHAHENLELLDHHFSSQGGLLALLPPGGETGKESETGIFIQWLRYTRSLVGRVTELEREVALMRELEHRSPKVRGQYGGGKGAKRPAFRNIDMSLLA